MELIFGRAALVLILLLASSGCQSPGEHSDASASQAAAPADDAYPDLHSVPPRPQLSYPVLQQGEIAGELRGDLANARYTEQVVRYRAGLSSLPPPPGPPPSALQASAELVTEAVSPSPGSDATQPQPMEDQAPPRSVADVDRGNLDDGGLDDMIEEMMIDTEDLSGADSPDDGDLPPAAGPASETAPEAGTTSEEMDGEIGPVNRLVDWLSGMLGEEETSVASDSTSADSDGRPLAVVLSSDRRAPTDGSRPIQPAAGDAPAPGGPASGEARTAEPSEPPVMIAAARPATEASTITVTTSGVDVAATAPDPDPAVISFAPGSAALAPPAVPKLERFLAEAGAQEDRITVLGEGTPPALAIDRARAVGQALVRLGASADRLRISVDADAGGDRARLVVTGPDDR